MIGEELIKTGLVIALFAILVACVILENRMVRKVRRDDTHSILSPILVFRALATIEFYISTALLCIGLLIFWVLASIE
jgi:hypothetical protein